MNIPIPGPTTIVITGDLTIDWNLIYFQGSHDTTAHWTASNVARACSQPGGVAMLARLIETIADKSQADRPVRICTYRLPVQSIHPSNPSYNHSYAIWSQMGEKDRRAWRVSQFLGIDQADTQAEEIRLVEDPESADIIVLDDANKWFRRQAFLWPRALDHLTNRPWIVLKTTYPIAKGELWNRLVEEWADRLIVVVAANDLRLSNAQISRGLSWERQAQDTLWELSYNPEIRDLTRSAHVIVSFQTDGAVLVSRTGQNLDCRLIFDPVSLENSWMAAYQGGMVGYNTCLTAAIVRGLAACGPAEDLPAEVLTQAVGAGLSAMRSLHSQGFEIQGEKPNLSIAFPYERIAAAIEKPAYPYAHTVVQNPLSILSLPKNEAAGQPRTGLFTILAQQCCDDLLGLARQIVTIGPEKALANIPLGKFGRLLTVDRNEIEGFRTIAALMQEYITQERMDKPISIAVFGAPGSGKSFGVKEIANSLSTRIKEITFNLSQMNSADDLIGALHQVRDEGLKGNLPLVFWDEFDSSLGGTPLGWLRYFLAPMQDGTFLEGQVTHPIGRAIFVFAGGTCERMVEFGKKLDPEVFKAVKGPDFKSRLKGFINILGPNPQRGVYDPFYLLRRAILLNSFLRRNAAQFFTPELQIDANLLDAFLETREYRHGARSMESIIAMSQLSEKTRFERSCLPPISQLNLHVIGWDFMARVQKLALEGATLQKLAEAVHEDFCRYMAEKGYIYGEETDDKETLKTSNALVPFAELPEGEKEQNRQNALDIPNKLANAGYVMIHARTNEPPLVFPDTDLDTLAKAEHNRWVIAKVEQDSRWQYAPKTDKVNFKHAGLLPWNAMSPDELAETFPAQVRNALGQDELPEREKEKDRELIRRIPHILSRIGYTVIKLENIE